MQPTPCAIQKIKNDMTDTGKEGAVAAASGRTEAPRRRKNDLPTEILDIIGPALKVGALSGMLFCL